ncbi:hypothetical protein, partial [Faecalimicrobium dakarense]|uniref:hypothetical protein n=1 Tax=Faecalimicrobium dakarense TaxID=1301100 RepID=UPI0005AB7088
MIKYLINKKMKKEAGEKGKKILLYSGVAITGVGAFCSYKAIKKYKQNKNNENYLDDSEYDIYAYDEYGYDHECGCENHEEVNEENFPKDELEEKIEEFNSRRITDENTPDADTNEMESKLNKIGNNKIDVKINENDYKEDGYNKYNYYDNNLKKKIN